MGRKPVDSYAASIRSESDFRVVDNKVLDCNKSIGEFVKNVTSPGEGLLLFHNLFSGKNLQLAGNSGKSMVGEVVADLFRGKVS